MLFSWIKSIFGKKRKLIAEIVDETGHLKEHSVTYTNNTFDKKLGGEKQAYIVDETCIVYKGKENTPTSFYYINNPQPIRFTHQRNKDLDSVGFKTILDSKAIKDLFASDAANLLFWIMIIVICNGLVTLFLIARSYGMFGSGGA